jgi:hypothetical protein
MIGNYCRPCGEMLTPLQTECPFCLNDAIQLDALIASCKAFALQLQPYEVSRVLNDAADAIAAGSRRAKIAQRAECEASQSGGAKTPHRPEQSA